MKKVIDEDDAEVPQSVLRQRNCRRVYQSELRAPEFSLVAIGGEQVTLDDLARHGKPVLLLFVSPNCVPCKALFGPRLARTGEA